VAQPVILAAQGAEIRRITVRSQPQANSLRDSISKITNKKRADGVAQVVECLASTKLCVQAPIPATHIKKKKKRKNRICTQAQNTFP
jgi:hypothetical protein